jgi:hypothetical protein
LDAPKSILETGKTLKTLSSGQIYKNKNKIKNPKIPTGLFFFFNQVFFQPCLDVVAQGADAVVGVLAELADVLTLLVPGLVRLLLARSAALLATPPFVCF